jgi:hypothetical protein
MLTQSSGNNNTELDSINARLTVGSDGDGDCDDGGVEEG